MKMMAMRVLNKPPEIKASLLNVNTTLFKSVREKILNISFGC